MKKTYCDICCRDITDSLKFNLILCDNEMNQTTLEVCSWCYKAVRKQVRRRIEELKEKTRDERGGER